MRCLGFFVALKVVLFHSVPDSIDINIADDLLVAMASPKLDSFVTEGAFRRAAGFDKADNGSTLPRVGLRSLVLSGFGAGLLN